MAGEHVCRIRVKPGAHCVTLACNRISARPDPPDITGHQREIDDRLSRARCRVTLVHTHRPPERNTVPAMDRRRKSLELLDTQSSRLNHHFPGELSHKVCKRLKTGGMLV